MEIWNGAPLAALRRSVNTPDKPECCRNCVGTMQKVDAVYTHFSRPLADKLLAGELVHNRAAS
jgi:hypothetical protein